MSPHLLPTDADLDDPLGFREGSDAPSELSEDDFDAELRNLLEGGMGGRTSDGDRPTGPTRGGVTAHAEPRSRRSGRGPADGGAGDAARRATSTHLERHAGRAASAPARPDHLTAGTLVLSAGLDAVLLNLHGKARRWFALRGSLRAR